jgi:hypothetical protein
MCTPACRAVNIYDRPLAAAIAAYPRPASQEIRRILEKRDTYVIRIVLIYSRANPLGQCRSIGRDTRRVYAYAISVDQATLVIDNRDWTP